MEKRPEEQERQAVREQESNDFWYSRELMYWSLQLRRKETR